MAPRRGGGGSSFSYSSGGTSACYLSNPFPDVTDKVVVAFSIILALGLLVTWVAYILKGKRRSALKWYTFGLALTFLLIASILTVVLAFMRYCEGADYQAVAYAQLANYIINILGNILLLLAIVLPLCRKRWHIHHIGLFIVSALGLTAIVITSVAVFGTGESQAARESYTYVDAAFYIAMWLVAIGATINIGIDIARMRQCANSGFAGSYSPHILRLAIPLLVSIVGNYTTNLGLAIQSIHSSLSYNASPEGTSAGIVIGLIFTLLLVIFLWKLYSFPTYVDELEKPSFRYQGVENPGAATGASAAEWTGNGTKSWSAAGGNWREASDGSGMVYEPYGGGYGNGANGANRGSAVSETGYNPGANQMQHGGQAQQYGVGGWQAQEPQQAHGGAAVPGQR